MGGPSPPSLPFELEAPSRPQKDRSRQGRGRYPTTKKRGALATEEQKPQELNDDELFDLIGAVGAGIGVAKDEGLPQPPVRSAPTLRRTPQPCSRTSSAWGRRKATPHQDSRWQAPIRISPRACGGPIAPPEMRNRDRRHDGDLPMCPCPDARCLSVLPPLHYCLLITAWSQSSRVWCAAELRM